MPCVLACLILALASRATLAQEEPPPKPPATCEGRGCACTGIDYGRKLHKHTQAVACIMLEPAGKKAVFYPRVDEYAVLELDNFDMNAGGLEDLWVAVEGSGTIGQASNFEWVDHTKRFKDGASVVPYYTVIVHLRDGLVERVQFDSGCHVCSPQAPSQCTDDGSGTLCINQIPGGSDYASCTDCVMDRGSCGERGCRPVVYLAWIGSDANGEPCTSAGKVISRFRAGSVNGLYDGGTTSDVSLDDTSDLEGA